MPGIFLRKESEIGLFNISALPVEMVLYSPVDLLRKHVSGNPEIFPFVHIDMRYGAQT